MLVAAAALGIAPPAVAHELGLIVVAAPGDQRGDAVEGFRLAIDQSPDVSHPPGRDAGDHLGGIDVDIEVVRSRTGARQVPRRVARAVLAGSRVVVVLPPARRALSIVSVAPASDILMVVPSRVATRARPVVVLSKRPPGEIDASRLTRFERAFMRRYGRKPSAAALAGYDAGRLLDALLAELGEGPFSGSTLTTAAARAGRTLVSSTATVVPSPAGTRVGAA